MRVGIIANPKANKIGQVLGGLLPWLKKRKVDVVVDEQTAGLGIEAEIVNINRLPALVDLIMVLGGDGTLLKAARQPGIQNTHILGINLGALGFLTEVTLGDMFPALEQVLSGEFVVDERQMIQTQIWRHNKIIGSYVNLNDIVIHKEVLARIIQLETYINGQYVNTFRADGLIVSTPTGSTAYSLSAGGPILYPSTQALVITPICPHTLSNRPIVITDNFRIEIKLKSKNENVYITCDGQQCLPLQYDDTVSLSKSAHSIKLIQPPHKNYYQVLRSKLNWVGGRINITNLSST